MGEKDTTNNRMELLAVIKGLETLSQNSEVVVYTDSQYVQGMTEWLEKWKLEEFRVKEVSGSTMTFGDNWIVWPQTQRVLEVDGGHSGHIRTIEPMPLLGKV